MITDFLNGEYVHEVQILIFSLTLGGVYALMASGLTLVFGVMRIVNLAHPAFIFIAAYISYYAFTELNLDPMESILINVPLMFIFGVIVYRVFLASGADQPRYTEKTVLLTFALALMIEGVLGYLFTGANRSTTPTYTTEVFFTGEAQYLVPKAQLYALLMSLVLIIFTWSFLQFTRMGYAIRATMQNRAAAQTVGVNVKWVSTFSFGMGTALAGAAGALMSFLFSFFPNTHWEWVALLLSLIVLGGMGSLVGAVVGAFLLAGTAGLVSDAYGPSWSPLTFYAALFLILLIRPQGLFGKKLEMT
ncbi:MAG: branched-chain amino acid ABC transporter permease [Chloroflexi bacterium]|nr:branched-chain amino acid ABC transporter permease [Chloroflexota bacterium]